MSDISQILAMDWHSGILFIAALVIVAVFVIQKFDWIIERFGLTSKRQLSEERQNKEIKELKEHTLKTDENVNTLIGRVNELIDSVKTLSSQVQSMQEKTNASDRSRLKDRIGQSYRVYDQKKCWTSMEKDAFDDLIRSYEDAGGSNSFVHTVCVPQSMTWQIVDEQLENHCL